MMRKKKIIVMIGLVVSLALLGGCKKELTQEEVEQSEYYTELLSQYNKITKENKKLTTQLEKATAEKPEDKETKELLEKIKRDSIIKLELSYGDTTSDSVFVENKGVLKLINQLANNADVVQDYKADDVKFKYQHLYNYTLYDEDNSVFELEVYDGNYVIFKDLPERVFYVYEASQFGDAFLARKDYYPTISARTKMVEAPIIIKGEQVYQKDKAKEVVTFIHSMEKQEIAAKKVKASLKNEYLFYYHGEIVTLAIGKQVIKIEDSEKATYYKVSAETVKELKQIFTKK